ncbi:MAG: ABC transporter ATP-binding protein [Tissierellia bacterium]|nr:ABC transporter ATP-binding protein [Tissierellia bacterium]
MSAIVISDLSKKFGREYVLDHLNVEILDGEFFSILGLAKSGKTTLTQILLNFLKPGGGTATIFDMDIKKDSKTIKDFCSYVSEDVWMYDNMKPDAIFRKTLSFHGSKNFEVLEELKEYFNFHEKKKFGHLSLRDKKLVGIINALMVSPKLIILDEPTKGLDDETAEKLFIRLKQLQREEGLTILLLTDSLPIAQRYSDRAAYLYQGEIKNIEHLKEKEGRDKILKIFDLPVDEDSFIHLGAKPISGDPDIVTFYYDGPLQALSSQISEAGLSNYNLEDATLKDKMEAQYKGGTQE